MPSPPRLDRDRAEWIAIRALAAIAEDPARLERFLSITGMMPGSARACASDHRFLAGVVDYVADTPGLMEDVGREIACEPADFAMAQYALRELPASKLRPDVVRLPIPPRRVS